MLGTTNLSRLATSLSLSLLACCLTEAQEPCLDIASTVFCDDFSDGDHTDGMPANWQLMTNLGTLGTADSTGGDLILTQPNTDPQVAYAGTEHYDMSIRSQFRQVEGSGAIALMGRLDPAGRTAYQGGIDTSDSTIYLVRNDNPFARLLVSKATDLNPNVEDVVLQLDIIGDDLSLYAWRAGEAMPAEPSLTRNIGGGYDSGVGGVLIDSGSRHSAAFRHVQVATTSIPEPSSAFICLFGAFGLLAFRRSGRDFASKSTGMEELVG